MASFFSIVILNIIYNFINTFVYSKEINDCSKLKSMFSHYDCIKGEAFCLTDDCLLCGDMINNNSELIFDNNGNLISFVLEVNGIKYYNKSIIPKILFEYPKLKELRIYGNIEDIPKDISDNNIIESISLSSNVLKTFPYQLTKLKHLEYLDLSLNELSGSLNKNFVNFQRIKRIDLGYNNLTGELIIPETLEHIDATQNKFNSILYLSDHRSVLQEFILYLNPYRTVRNNDFDDKVFEDIQDFEILTNLDLSNNMKITKVPSTISSSSFLESFDISNCNVKEISSNIFKLQKLKEFSISNNTNLNISIINFKNKYVYCDIEDVNVLCYETGSCKNVKIEEYKNCTQEEINNVIKSQTPDIIKPKKEEKEKQFKNINIFLNNNINLIIFLSIFLILILIIISINYICNKKRNNNDIIITRIETKRLTSNNNINKNYENLSNQNNNNNFSTYNQTKSNNKYNNSNTSVTSLNINQHQHLQRYSDLIDDDHIGLIQRNNYK
ncbi:L domain-like protein [Anaeromyces robustus]|uniref:L domain-like protein n=1 Tax=Anaeromyces robustus TaxID=1754192 RepID=A0A1Y1XGA7_9FUNG|nr:L domain-like protein [Anaeromyces robustus]|eukprot:ORX84799.1 L domain-like protein [Anaeromyces robustus]